MIERLFELLMGHAVADFALQSDWMAKNKNPNYRNVPPQGQKWTPTWFYVLGAHALIHGAMVYVITNNIACAVFQTVTHGFIDWGKCMNFTDPHVDQLLHMLTLVVIGGVS